MARNKFQRKRYFFHQKLSNCLQKCWSHWTSTFLKIWVENPVFAIQHIENRKKVLLKCFPPRDQTNPFAYCCSFIFHTSYENGMIGHGGGGGGRCQNTQKQFIIKTYSEHILCKPVGKYQFIMACNRALVMIAYQVINCLISQPKHMLWVLKRTIAMRRFF